MTNSKLVIKAKGMLDGEEHKSTQTGEFALIVTGTEEEDGMAMEVGIIGNLSIRDMLALMETAIHGTVSGMLEDAPEVFRENLLAEIAGKIDEAFTGAVQKALPDYIPSFVADDDEGEDTELSDDQVSDIINQLKD